MQATAVVRRVCLFRACPGVKPQGASATLFKRQCRRTRTGRPTVQGKTPRRRHIKAQVCSGKTSVRGWRPQSGPFRATRSRDFNPGTCSSNARYRA